MLSCFGLLPSLGFEETGDCFGLGIFGFDDRGLGALGFDSAGLGYFCNDLFPKPELWL